MDEQFYTSMTVKKGGSPTGDERSQIIDSIMEVLKEELVDASADEKDRINSKIKEIKELRLKNVYLGAFNDGDHKYYIMKKPMGPELANAHLELLLELQGNEPIIETDEKGHTIKHTSPATKEARKRAMLKWFADTLPAMLIYPTTDDLNFAEQFYMFNVVFNELESGARYFRPVG